MKDQLTIALPVYKRTDFVKSALDSCVRQTVPCRILLIDNNSPHDEFLRIVEGYNNPDLKYYRNPETVPQDENFNNCFRLSETPWVTILHDDDMLHCQFVEVTARILEKTKGEIGGFAVGSSVGETEWPGIWQKKNIPGISLKALKEPFFYFSHLTPFPGVVVKREAALNIGGFTNKLFPIADFDFWYRYSRKEQLYKTDELMAYYRISPHQSTTDAFYDMINKIYDYRKGIVAKGNNNIITRLALEYSRLNNIDYFKRSYKAFDRSRISETNFNRNASKIISLPLVKRLLVKYIEFISYKSEQLTLD